MLPWVEELLESIRLISLEHYDLIIEAPVAMGGYHIASKMNIPYIELMLFPWRRTIDFPHPFAVPCIPLGSHYNFLSHLGLELILWHFTKPVINKWRVNSLGLAPLASNSFSRKSPFIFAYSSYILPQPKNWPDHIHTCGYFFLDQSEHNWEPPESLLKFLNRDRVIYIGFGSIVVKDSEKLMKILLTASKMSNSNIIISRGWSDRITSNVVKTKEQIEREKNEIETLNPNVYILDKVPHDWLFPKVYAVMHHGGAGTRFNI
jgi:sterol 3beta-glucosyltransferase